MKGGLRFAIGSTMWSTACLDIWNAEGIRLYTDHEMGDAMQIYEITGLDGDSVNSV